MTAAQQFYNDIVSGPLAQARSILNVSGDEMVYGRAVAETVQQRGQL
jgi:hypothetical protein